jgi:putative tryptophan/tyrosine transport system substrate-binding protein
VPTVSMLFAGDLPEFQIRVFREGLRELGYVERQNIRVEIRSVEGDAPRLPDLAAALVREKVDVIVPFGTNAALAAKHATREIPIVLLANGDPVGMGIVASLAHPGGNITGTSPEIPQLAGKHVKLLKEVLPRLRRIAALCNASDPVFADVFLENIRLADKTLQVDIVPVTVTAGPELDAAFPAMVGDKVGAIIVQGSLLSRHVADLALADEVIE